MKGARTLASVGIPLRLVVAGLALALGVACSSGADEAPPAPAVSDGDAAAAATPPSTATPTPSPATPTATPVVVPDELSDLVLILRDLELTEPEIAEAVASLHDDPEDDFFYATSTLPPGNPGDDIDIIRYGRYLASLSQEQADRLFNATAFPCATETGGRRVLCVDEDLVQPLTAGRVALVLMVTKGLAAADDSLTYMYAAVFDSDGDPETNFEPFGNFDWDGFRDTDRWYVWDFMPEYGNSRLTASQVQPMDFPELLPSAARLIVEGNAFVFLIPESELDAAAGYRVFAARTSAGWSAATSASDVNGANPTEPLAR